MLGWHDLSSDVYLTINIDLAGNRPDAAAHSLAEVSEAKLSTACMYVCLTVVVTQCHVWPSSHKDRLLEQQLSHQEVPRRHYRAR